MAQGLIGAICDIGFSSKHSSLGRVINEPLWVFVTAYLMASIPEHEPVQRFRAKQQRQQSFRSKVCATQRLIIWIGMPAHARLMRVALAQDRYGGFSVQGLVENQYLAGRCVGWLFGDGLLAFALF